MTDSVKPTQTALRLTQFSHGGGCGCKLSPKVLQQLLAGKVSTDSPSDLLVGNGQMDDAAVYQINDKQAVISTTDFFLPIVDDAYAFGQIAACNAISDVYAMGGKPLMAIAILGWPIDKLSSAQGAEVLDGGKAICKQAGIPLAGGHSIDAQEPFFGLAVTGEVNIQHLKRNHTAQAGDAIFITKPIGIGVLGAAEKDGVLTQAHKATWLAAMTQLNQFGVHCAAQPYVHAMTDVTGFGLAGHLLEVCRGSQLAAQINTEAVPLLDGVVDYINAGHTPGGGQRNHDSYGEQMSPAKNAMQQAIICDPQTSGGLLICVAADAVDEFKALAQANGQNIYEIGSMLPEHDQTLRLQLD